MYFVYLGGCAAIIVAYYVAATVVNFVFGPPDDDEFVGERPSAPTECNVTAETPEATLSKKQRQEILNKQVLETKARLEELQLRYREKYNVDLTDLSGSKNSSVKSSSTKKRGIRTRKRESGTSCSSNDSSTSASTVIHRSSANGTISAETFVLEDASTIYNSAKNTSFSKEETRVRNDPLGGKLEVEPNDKVEQWLQNSLPPGQSVNDGKSKTKPKPVLMIIPVHDPPRSKASADSDCETYVPSCKKKESPKMTAPHLYKRLTLRKKSSVDSAPLKRTFRKLKVGNKDVPNTLKERLKTPSVPGKSCNRQTDLKEKTQQGALHKSSAGNSLANEDSDRETLVNYVCEGYSSSESEHFIEPIRTASAELVSNTLYNKSIGYTIRPNSSGKQDSMGKAKSLESSRPRSKSSHRTKVIDEVLDLQSKSIDKRKSSPAVVNKRSKSVSSQLSDSSEQNKNCFGNDNDGEVIWSKKTAQSGTNRERKPILGRSESPKRERSNPDGAISGEELEWRSKLPEKKKGLALKLTKKVSSSSLKPNTNANVPDKKTEALSKNNVPNSASKERPKTADNDKLSPRSLSEKSKEFLKKYRLRDSSCHERSKSAEIKEVLPKVNQFEMRKGYQSKYHMKETSDKSDEKDTLTAKSNQFEKRRLFQAKYHIKCSVPKDEQSHSDKIQAKDLVKGSYAEQERPKTAGNEVYMQHKSEKRKDALKLVDTPTKSKSHGNVEVLHTMKPDTKGKDHPGQGTIPKKRSAPEKEVASEKPKKLTPLQRRMEYDAKCRMKSSSNLQKSNSAAEEALTLKAILREKKQNYNSQFKMKTSDSNPSRPATSEKPRAPSPAVDKKPDPRSQKTVTPTMNRQPNDQARLAYVFDWDSKIYVVAKKPEISEDEKQVSEPVKPRESSVPPPAKKKLPPPRGVRRPLSASGKRDVARPSSASTSNKDPLNGMRKLATGSEDECRYVRKNKGSEWSISSSSSIKSKASIDFEFDVKGLSNSNCSSTVSSELSEDTMIKELQNARVDSEDQVGKGLHSQGGFVMPKCQSAHLRNNSNTGSNLQNILDTPMNSGGFKMNNNLLSRSDAKVRVENENTTRDQVFTGTTALKRSSKGLLHNGSKETVSVLTSGFKKLALDESLGGTK